MAKSMRNTLFALALSALLAAPAYSEDAPAAPQNESTLSQDAHVAGQDIKRGVVRIGHGIHKAASEVGHEVKRGATAVGHGFRDAARNVSAGVHRAFHRDGSAAPVETAQ
ncbi:hypothetical protein [Paludibacterium yongneupense]|uniref:hypothetical protein n=1 Tax=Paludibacterium yongneupense TaxID=400061 RepID=UPI00040063F5|nr:hypothetical protein [Paludibacterium yongneupense]